MAFIANDFVELLAGHFDNTSRSAMVQINTSESIRQGFFDIADKALSLKSAVCERIEQGFGSDAELREFVRELFNLVVDSELQRAAEFEQLLSLHRVELESMEHFRAALAAMLEVPYEPIERQGD